MSDHIVDASKIVPWANEPTPLTDCLDANRTAFNDFGLYCNALKHARYIERRMRTAERRLAEVIAGYEAERDSEFDWIDWYEKAKPHLEAAKKEDGR